MQLEQIFNKDGKFLGHYYCTKCGVIHKDKEGSYFCCERVCECGAKCETGWVACKDCRKKNEIKREKERFNKAEKILEKDWKGPVFCDGYGNEYFSDLDELYDHIEFIQEDDCIIDYVYCCDEEPLVKDRDILDLVSSLVYEDAPDNLRDVVLNGTAELSKACKKFAEDNKEYKLWNPDYSRAIILDYTRLPRSGN